MSNSLVHNQEITLLLEDAGDGGKSHYTQLSGVSLLHAQGKTLLLGDAGDGGEP